MNGTARSVSVPPTPYHVRMVSLSLSLFLYQPEQANERTECGITCVWVDFIRFANTKRNTCIDQIIKCNTIEKEWEVRSSASSFWSVVFHSVTSFSPSCPFIKPFRRRRKKAIRIQFQSNELAGNALRLLRTVEDDDDQNWHSNNISSNKLCCKSVEKPPLLKLKTK